MAGDATSAGASRAPRAFLLRRLLPALLVAALFFAPLAVGTVHPWTRGVVFGLAALAWLVALAQRLVERKPLAITVPLVALAVAVLATAAQLVPLPAPVVAALSPAAHELLSLRGYTWHPLSLEPAATAAELAKLGAYLAFFAAASIYGSRRERRRNLVFAVAAAATLVALIGLAQAALGVKEILGVYQPHAEWTTLVRGTFVNPNHFGALLCLGAPAAMTIALREPRHRALAFACTFIIDVAVVLTLQRATIFAAGLGHLLVFAVDRLQLRRGSGWLRSRALVRGTLAVTVVAALAVAVGFGRDRLQSELARTVELEDLRDPLSKMRVWGQSMELVWTHPWTGIGRGAFPQVFTRVSDVGGYTRYEWAENGYVQALVDWGVPVTLLLVLLAVWSAALAVRRLADDPLALGALAGLVALAVHEAADFAVELPGVALPALALAACLFGRRSSTPAAGQRLVPARAAALALPVLLLLPFALELRLPSIAEDTERLTELARNPHVPIEEVLAAGDAARARHPADYYLCALVAERLARAMRPEAMRWLNEAMYLNPTHPAPHLMAAEVLAASRHKSQALVEYRHAAAGAPEPRTLVWERVLARYPALDDLLAATPDDARHLAMLGKWLRSKGRDGDAEVVYARLLEQQPDSQPALEALVRLALARRDAAAAHQRLARLAAVDDGPGTRGLEIEERVLAGDLRQAVALLDAHAAGSSSFDLELLVGEALARAGRADQAMARLDRLVPRDLDAPSRIRLFETRALVQKLAGNEHLYKWELEQRDRLLGK